MTEQEKRAYEVFIDPATGLYDRRTMWFRLAEESSRARRYRYPLSLILIAFDTPESEEAVELTLQLAEILKQRTRAADILVRYSEDTLAILLPCTGEAGALQLAERIRHLTTDAQPPDREGGPIPVSIGVTSASSDYHWDKISLVEQVERALRQAQREGGGGIVVVMAPRVSPILSEEEE